MEADGQLRSPHQPCLYCTLDLPWKRKPVLNIVPPDEIDAPHKNRGIFHPTARFPNRQAGFGVQPQFALKRPDALFLWRQMKDVYAASGVADNSGVFEFI